MSKPIIIIADTDVNYLYKLEFKLLEMLGNRIELEVISDVNYFLEYFSRSKTAEILVVDEKLYTSNLMKHNIAHIFMLTEKVDNGNTEDLSLSKLYKYSGIKELYNEITYKSKDKFAVNEYKNEETKVISFYAATGGVGKTAVSMSLAKSLVENHKKVLYISTETIQSFIYFLKDKTCMPNSGYKEMCFNRSHVYEIIKLYIKKADFYYIVPLMRFMDSFNMDSSVFLDIIKQAKESKEYDYIIVDIEARHNDNTMQLLQMSNKVIIVTLQDDLTILKTNILLDNMDMSDKDKYKFICNKYTEEKEGGMADMKNGFVIDENIEMVSNNEIIDNISRLKNIQKLVYMFL